MLSVFKPCPCIETFTLSLLTSDLLCLYERLWEGVKWSGMLGLLTQRDAEYPLSSSRRSTSTGRNRSKIKHRQAFVGIGITQQFVIGVFSVDLKVR